VLLKFGRYHTQAQRSFYRALNELNKIQSLRRRNQAIESQDLSSSLLGNGQNRSRDENQMAGDASN